VYRILIAALLMLVWPAAAETYVIEMRTHAPDGRRFVFQPDLLRIEPGDTVHFVAADKGHNVASVDGMIPDGARPWKGRLSQDLEVTFDVPGIYGFRCIPHYAMGMVGLIVVGDAPANLQQARTKPHAGRARVNFARLFERLEAGD